VRTTSLQTTCEIILYIDNRLQPNRDAYQPIGDARSRTRFRRNARMGGAGRMGDGGFGIAQIRGDGQQLGAIDQSPRRLLATLDFERHDAAAGLLLAHRQRVLRMRRQAGIKHARDIRLLLQPARQFQRVRTVRVHTQLERFQSFQKHPGIERAHGRPCGAQELVHAFQIFLAAQYRAAQYATLTVDVLGRGVDHEIRTQLQGALQDGRAETIIDREQCAASLGNGGNGGDVGNLRERIGGRFQEK
jgi:hypothetical protein